MTAYARTENAARLGALLARRLSDRNVVRDVIALQRAARALHLLSVRACNEDFTCSACGGDGDGPMECVSGDHPHQPCPKCDGTGLTIGKRRIRLADAARSIAYAYGFRLYVQCDPLGWPLYLIPETYPPSEDSATYDLHGVAVCPL